MREPTPSEELHAEQQRCIDALRAANAHVAAVVARYLAGQATRDELAEASALAEQAGAAYEAAERAREAMDALDEEIPF